MTSQTTISPSRTGRRRIAEAFTLIELVIVLVIISAMVTVTVPYATRSSEGVMLEQASRDLVEAVKYTMYFATDTKRRARLVIDFASGSYVIEVAPEMNDRDFERPEDDRAGPRCLAAGIRIVDFEGLTMSNKNRYCLVFDPGQPWPHARLSLTARHTQKTIRIAGRAVDIEDGSD
jgi:type II secretory pathway pseudopilin PulG